MTKYLVIALLATSASGCKQDLGGRCQVNEDCASNKCSNSNPQVCVSVDDNSQIQVDAEVPPAPIDAAIDAPPDGP